MGALDPGIRRKLFYAMATLFALVTPLTLLYSQGYILDFQQGGIVATGGIFVKASPPGVRVIVTPEEQTRETSLISRGALFAGLIPRRYTVRVEKDKYQTWQKSVRVNSEEVLEFRDVLLPPAATPPSIVFTARPAETAAASMLIGRRDIAITANASSQGTSVFVVDPVTRQVRLNFIRLDSWHWDAATRTFIIGRIIDGKREWYRLRADAEGKEERIAFRGLPAGFAPDQVLPHPTNAGQIFFSANNALFLQGNAAVPTPIAESIHAYAIGAGRIYYLTQNGFFVESDLVGQNVRILGRKGLFLSNESPARIEIGPDGTAAVLDSAGGLFVFQPDRDQELQLVLSNVRDIEFAASGDRMLIWNPSHMWIYWLRDNPRQPFDLAGTRQQILALAEPILGAQLDADGTHIFFATADSIRMTEIDIRGAPNIHQIVGAPIDSFALDRDSRTIYWTRGPTLYRATMEPAE
ncbi:hypothetical protein C4552_00940 [Candidatus Parcubacteria bacterium]|nr:MAG: hypothetical protein C4552_00940 [Candidatus Parcubacteria bacterium]